MNPTWTGCLNCFNTHLNLNILLTAGHIVQNCIRTHLHFMKIGWTLWKLSSNQSLKLTYKHADADSSKSLMHILLRLMVLVNSEIFSCSITFVTGLKPITAHWHNNRTPIYLAKSIPNKIYSLLLDLNVIGTFTNQWQRRRVTCL